MSSPNPPQPDIDDTAANRDTDASLDTAALSATARTGSSATARTGSSANSDGVGKARSMGLFLREHAINRSTAGEVALAFTALIFLAAYSYEILRQPTGVRLRISEIVLWGTWLIFAIDYFWHLWRPKERGRFLFGNLLGFALVVLPMLQPLRILRLVSLVVVLRRLLMTSSIRVTVVWFSTIATGLLIYVSSLAILEFEREAPDSLITTFGQALWWAIASVTTVGYGDTYPVTAPGRLIAVVLMINGIAVLGIVTATLASWIVDRVAEENEEQDELRGAEIRNLTDQVRDLRVEISELRHHDDRLAAESVHAQSVHGQRHAANPRDRNPKDRGAKNH